MKIFQSLYTHAIGIIPHQLFLKRNRNSVVFGFRIRDQPVGQIALTVLI